MKQPVKMLIANVIEI